MLKKRDKQLNDRKRGGEKKIRQLGRKIREKDSQTDKKQREREGEKKISQLGKKIRKREPNS